MSDHAFLLLKMGELEHMKRLLFEGEVHLKPMVTFSTIIDSERVDPREGSGYVTKKTRDMTISVMSDGGWKAIDGLTVTEVRLPSPQREHLSYSMSKVALAAPERGELDDPAYFERDGEMTFGFPVPFVELAIRLGAFGVLIQDIEVFVAKFEEAAATSGFKLVHQSSEYVQECEEMNWGPFVKPNHLRHQAEYRFVSTAKVDGPMNIHLGPLGEIASLLDFTTFSQL